MLRPIMRAWVVWLTVGLIALYTAQALLAHANLAESSPAANEILDAAPDEIRLRLTDPLEPGFSTITLFDGSGSTVDLPDAVIDSTDPHVMFVSVPPLADGVYTIAWRVVSAADGHPTQGTIPFLIGVGSTALVSAQDIEQPIPVVDTIIRWINYLSQALAIGAVGFWLFVWSPAIPDGNRAVERGMMIVIGLAWVALGVSAVLILLLQVSLATGVPFSETLSSPSINQLVSDTRFGQIWVLRIALWFGFGGALFMAVRNRWYLWVALLLGAGTLLTTSLFSHASAAPTDVTAAIVADWMHIGAAALWVGGLIQFVVVIVAVRRHVAPSAAALSRLVGYFTNFARVAVAGLILTGFFASWLHVHSFEALVTTTYGGLLMIKLGLFIPLIGLAAYNLFFTQRGLKQGQERWGARLRGSVSAEILLTVSILAVVGAMASTPPAKTVYDARAAAQAAAAPSDPIRETLTVNGVAATLDIAPGYTGSNTFTLTLIDGDEQPVTDASRIRMIFRNLTEGGGDSELRLEHQGDGVYTVIGANISVAGSWRLRTTVAREGEFDRVYDFTPEMTAAPAPPPATRVDLGASMPDRVPILLAVGLLAVAVGGYFLGESRWRIFQGAGFIAVALLIVGIVFLASSLNALPA